MDQVYVFSLGCLTLLLLSYQLVIELYQALGTSLKAYFLSIQNSLDLFQYLSTAWVVLWNLVHLNDGEDQHAIANTDQIRIISALSVFVLWLKLFDWLRLFEQTAFYIKLLTATFMDLRSFMLLFFTGLAMFGSSIYMLQSSGNDNAII